MSVRAVRCAFPHNLFATMAPLAVLHCAISFRAKVKGGGCFAPRRLFTLTTKGLSLFFLPVQLVVAGLHLLAQTLLPGRADLLPQLVDVRIPLLRSQILHHFIPHLRFDLVVHRGKTVL